MSIYEYLWIKAYIHIVANKNVYWRIGIVGFFEGGGVCKKFGH